MIYLTSFFKSKELPEHVERYSAAVYQPKGYTFPKVDWTDIRDSTGAWTRPRNFVDDEFPAQSYRESLYALYLSRIHTAREWVDLLVRRDAALCCWCPSDKAAQRQLEEFGSFICHTAVLGEFISTEFSVPVWYDADRVRMSVLTQRGL